MRVVASFGYQLLSSFKLSVFEPFAGFGERFQEQLLG